MSEKSSVSQGFGIGVGIVLAFIAVNLIIGLAVLLIERHNGRLINWPFRQSAAVVGTPGSGYVSGAPRNAQECVRRGGTVVYGGRGCENYR